MDKFLITPRAYNKKLGPIMVTTSARASCPKACPLSRRALGPLKGTCYAEQGFIGAYMWANLDRVPVGGTFKKGQIKIHSYRELLGAVKSLPEGAIWRHNQAGDLSSDDGVTINRTKLQQLTDANSGRHGFTFTHYPMLDHAANRDAVKEANANGFRINLSADSLSHADALVSLDIAPVVTLLPEDTFTNTTTPEGRKVVICPAIKNKQVSCATCEICTKMRKAIIGFPAIGRQKHKVGDSPNTNRQKKKSQMIPVPTPLDLRMEAERQRLSYRRQVMTMERADIDASITKIETELAALLVYENARGVGA